MRKKKKSIFTAAALKYTKEYLFLSATNGNLGLIQAAIESGVDVNAKNINGSTPLHIVAAHGHVSCIAYLLSKGSDINASGQWQQAPLHVAVKHNRLECAIHLLKHGADITLRDAANNTALDIAIEKEYHQIADLINAAIDDRKLNAEINNEDHQDTTIAF